MAWNEQNDPNVARLDRIGALLDEAVALAGAWRMAHLGLRGAHRGMGRGEPGWTPAILAKCVENERRLRQELVKMLTDPALKD